MCLERKHLILEYNFVYIGPFLKYFHWQILKEIL